LGPYTRVFQADPAFAGHLERELGVWEERGGLYFAESPPHPVFWHRNLWEAPFIAQFDSISGAAKILRDIQRNWAPILWTQFRRGALIAQKLPPISRKPRPFPWVIPDTPMGAWTLLDHRTLAVSADCTSPFPAGVIDFPEDHHGPPSRAYLKLWEALVLAGSFPAAGERCFDAGASPGGWTWTLANLGASVVACDRTPLDARIAALPGVTFVKHDAFTLNPQDIGPIDWLFCDAACYPQRLLGWIEKWLASGLCKRFVCTIKMQGSLDGTGANTVDFDTPRRFAALPGGRVVHLYHNKHELTWLGF
jgi:23S rRNA (cytidine2498-2'-O)-methyltransferase